jgi:hypothetical protein
VAYDRVKPTYHRIRRSDTTNGNQIILDLIMFFSEIPLVTENI